MKKKILNLIAVGLLVGPAVTTASEIGFTFSGGQAQSGQPATYGFQFTPVANIYLDGLGFIDAGSDGLAAGHRVGVWDSAGNLLTSTTVTTANSTLSGPTINGGQFRFVNVADLLLTQGATYTLGAAVEGASDPWYAAFGLTQIGNPNLATVSSIGYYEVCVFCKPTQTIENRYGIGSFTARRAVPEPGTLALLGLGLAGLGLSRRRKAA